MAWRVARNYRFLLEGTDMSEREVSRNCSLSRQTLMRFRHIPYGAREDVELKTTREVESVFELPPGWICITPHVRLGLGIEGGGSVPIGTAATLREKHPEWSFQEGSQILVLLAQDAPLEAAVEIIT